MLRWCGVQLLPQACPMDNRSVETTDQQIMSTSIDLLLPSLESKLSNCRSFFSKSATRTLASSSADMVASMSFS